MAKRRIVISERDNIAALFEEDQAIEFIIHRGDMLLGDVYLATVENILPSIDAGFVNVGGDKMGFLHSSDVQGRGDLRNRLQPKQRLVVQVMKEPTGHKGPRVTTNISLPGRFLVLMPESKGISISRKIEQPSERSRLKAIVSLMKPTGMGVIIRTEADGQNDSDIQEDMEILLERWQNIVTMADTAQPPTLLYRDQDLLYRVIRETVTEDVQEIIVDTTFGYQRAQQLLQNWNLDKRIKVTHYNGTQSIMVAMGVEREIKQALQTKVPLPSGGYLYIQPTEALTVVDVNSGKFTSLQSQADTIRITNLEATKEIARQLRLRNIGGMIIVDFIDMESRADKLTILEAFENALSPDKSKPQIGQLSDLGLVEMTRHRQGQALSEMFTKRCIACTGTGHALEEFNWAPPSMDGDVRQNDRNYGRSKLPIRSGRNAQPQTHNARPVPISTTSSSVVQKMMTQSRPLPQQGAGSSQDGRGGHRPDGRKDSLIFQPGSRENHASGDSRQSQPQESKPNDIKPMDLKSLDECLRDILIDRFGLKLSSIVKLALTPPGINAILSRINPKSNDILTLVLAIESAASLPPELRPASGLEEDLDDSDSENGENDTPESETAEPETTDIEVEKAEPVAAKHVEALVASSVSQPSFADEASRVDAPVDSPVLFFNHPPEFAESAPEPANTTHTAVEDLSEENGDSDDEDPDEEEGDSPEDLLVADPVSDTGKPKRRRGRPPKRAKLEPSSAMATGHHEEDSEDDLGNPGPKPLPRRSIPRRSSTNPAISVKEPVTSSVSQENGEPS